MEPLDMYEQASAWTADLVRGATGKLDQPTPCDDPAKSYDTARAEALSAFGTPAGSEKAYETIHGKFTEEQRQGIFKPEVKAADSASPQEKLLAYTGRTP